MVTTAGPEPKPTTTVKRSYLLHWQVRNLLARTTQISQETLAKIDTALTNRWIHKIGVYGLDDSGRCHVGLELRINWGTHMVQLLLAGDNVSIDRKIFSPDDLAPEVHNAICVFNQAVNAECLRTKVRLSHPHMLRWSGLGRSWGLSPSRP
jgi:hypothetical protein